MSRIVRLSFDPAVGDETPPFVTLHNPEVLIPALRDQVTRYGLRSDRGAATMSGRLKGSRRDFMNTIQSYGYALEIVPAETSASGALA